MVCSILRSVVFPWWYASTAPTLVRHLNQHGHVQDPSIKTNTLMPQVALSVCVPWSSNLLVSICHLRSSSRRTPYHGLLLTPSSSSIWKQNNWNTARDHDYCCTSPTQTMYITCCWQGKSFDDTVSDDSNALCIKVKFLPTGTWWFQPIWKIYTVIKLDNFPNVPGEHKKYKKMTLMTPMGNTQMLHVGNMYLHFPLSVAMFHHK